MKAKVIRDLALVCLLLPGTAVALKGTKVINGGSPLYIDLPNVRDVNVTEMPEIRQAGIFNILGKYRLANGLTSIKRGETITFMWPDGSIEKAVAGDPRSTYGALIIEGSQMTRKQVALRCGSCHTQYR